eukprot:4801654-Prymnesium_polylepis.1
MPARPGDAPPRAALSPGAVLHRLRPARTHPTTANTNTRANIQHEGHAALCGRFSAAATSMGRVPGAAHERGEGARGEGSCGAARSLCGAGGHVH